MYQLVKYRTVLTIAAVFVMGLALVPTVALGVTNNDLGVGGFANELDLGNATLPATIASIINVALSLLGIVAVVIILIAGFKYMTAGGNDEKTGEARKLMFAGIIGLAIILSAWAIAKFVLASLSTATGTGNLVP